MHEEVPLLQGCHAVQAGPYNIHIRNGCDLDPREVAYMAIARDAPAVVIRDQAVEIQKEIVAVAIHRTVIPYLGEDVIESALGQVPVAEIELPGPIDEMPKPEKCVAYTAVAGNFDLVRLPKIAPGIEYRVYTDNPDVVVGCPGEQVKVLPLPRRTNDPNLDAKFLKVFPHLLLEESHEWSIWVDANVELVSPPYDLIDDVARQGGRIGCYKHYERCTALSEYRQCQIRRKDIPENLDSAIWKLGLSSIYIERLGECGVLVRNHAQSNVQNAMREWWACIVQTSKRDQLSFMPSVYKNGVAPVFLRSGAKDVRTDPVFCYYPHGA